jgi:superfamily I DNA/RNA helicase
MAYDYLAGLNPQQRRAVKHGVRDGAAMWTRPLLVIAGAGTGKTKTLAHRAAHLIVNGIDPHRILLLTFSRRAAAEMTGRVKRITAAALGTEHIDLPWAGTFHAVGARLLREYAHRIGLKPSFTILDRSDAADLMDLVRHELKFSKKDSRFPKKDTLGLNCSFKSKLRLERSEEAQPVFHQARHRNRRFTVSVAFRPTRSRKAGSLRMSTIRSAACSTLSTRKPFTPSSI